MVGKFEYSENKPVKYLYLHSSGKASLTCGDDEFYNKQIEISGWVFMNFLLSIKTHRIIWIRKN